MKRELDLYKKVLRLELDEEVKYLHYGLFEKESDTISIAQERSNILVNDTINRTNGRLLEVGCGLGFNAKNYANNGFKVIALEPKKEHYDIAYKDQTVNPLIFNCNFEEFSGINSSYDVVIFHESAQYIDPYRLLEKSYDLLKLGGQLVILDEIPKYLISNFTDLIYGKFSIKTIKNLTEQASPSVDYLIDAINNYKTFLLENFSVTELNTMIIELTVRKKDYKSKDYSYLLISLEKI